MSRSWRLRVEKGRLAWSLAACMPWYLPSAYAVQTAESWRDEVRRNEQHQSLSAHVENTAV